MGAGQATVVSAVVAEPTGSNLGAPESGAIFCLGGGCGAASTRRLCLSLLVGQAGIPAPAACRWVGVLLVGGAAISADRASRWRWVCRCRFGLGGGCLHRSG